MNPTMRRPFNEDLAPYLITICNIKAKDKRKLTKQYPN